MSSIDPIQQPVSSHQDANGNVPATTDLWDKNAAIVDQQLKKTTASQQSNGWINLPAGLSQEVAGDPGISLSRYHSGGLSYFRLSGSAILFERPLEAIIDGVYCQSPPNGNTDMDSLEGYGLANYAPSVGTERQHALVLRNKTQLDANNWPTGIGELALLHGAPGPLGASLEVNTQSGELLVVKLKSVNVGGVVSVTMLPHVVPKAKLQVMHSDLPDRGNHSHAAIDLHLDDRANPHQVTLDQAVASDPTAKLTGANIADRTLFNDHIALGTLTEDRMAFAVTNSFSRILYPHIVGEEGTIGLTSVPDLKGSFQLPLDRQILLNGRLTTPYAAVVQNRKGTVQSYVLNRSDLSYPLDTPTGDDLLTDRSASIRHQATDGYLGLGKSAVSMLATTVPLGNQKERVVVSWTPSDNNTGVGYGIERKKSGLTDNGGYPLPALITSEGLAASGLYATYHSSHAMDDTDYVGYQVETSLDFDWGNAAPAPVAYALGGSEGYSKDQWAATLSTFLRPIVDGTYQLKLEFDAAAIVSARFLQVTNNQEIETGTWAAIAGGIESSANLAMNASSSYRLEITYKANIVAGTDCRLKASWKYAPTSGSFGSYSAIDPRHLALGRKQGFYTHVYRTTGTTDSDLTRYRGSLREGQLLPEAGAARLTSDTYSGFVRHGLLNLGGLGGGIPAMGSENYVLKVATTRHVKLYLNDAEVASGGSANNYTFALPDLVTGVDYRLRLESWGSTSSIETLTCESPAMPATYQTVDILNYIRPDVTRGLKLDLYALSSEADGSDNPFVTGASLNHAAVLVSPTPDSKWTNKKPPFLMGNDSGATNPYRFAAEWSGWLTVPKTGPYVFQFDATTAGLEASLDVGSSALVALGTAAVTVNLNAGHRVRLSIRAWQKATSDAPTVALKWDAGDGSPMAPIPVERLIPDLFLIDEIDLGVKYQYLVTSSDDYLLELNKANRIGETPSASGHPGFIKSFGVDDPAPLTGTLSYPNSYGEQTNSIRLKWDIPAGLTVDSTYRLITSIYPNEFDDPIQTDVFTASGGTASFTVTGLGEGTPYYFCIEARDGDDEAGPRNFVAVSTTVDTSTLNFTSTPSA